MTRTLYALIGLFLSFAISHVYGQISVSSPASGSTVSQCGSYIIHFNPGVGFSGNATAEIHLNNSSGPVVQTVGYPSGYLSGNYDNSFSASSLTPGSSYQIKVYDAYNSSNAAWSGIFTVTSLTAPTAIYQTMNNYTWIEINWPSVSGASSYGVDVATASDFSSDVVWNNHTATGTDYYGLYINGLTAGTTYYVRIKSTGPCGTSGYSSTYSFSTLTCTPPSAPTATAATNVKTAEFTANWTAVSGVTNYDLVITRQGFAPITRTGLTGTSYRFTPAHPASNYSYTVKSDIGCATAESNSISLTTTALATPAIWTTGGADEESRFFKWNAVDGASYYHVQLFNDMQLSDLADEHDVDGLEYDYDQTPCNYYWVRVRAVAATGEVSAYSQDWLDDYCCRLCCQDCRIAADGTKDEKPIISNPIDWLIPFVPFPNPADRTLTVGLPPNFHLETFSYKTLDATGRDVMLPFEISQTKATFDVSGIGPGVYLLTVTDGIVKQRTKFLRK